MAPRGDAVQEQPTVDEQMAVFKGFSTTDGEVSDGAPSPKENEVAEQEAAAQAQAKAVAEKNEARRAPLKEQKAEADGEKKPPEEKVPPGVQKRINEAVRKQRSAERAAEEANSKLASMEARLAALEKGEKTAPLTSDSTKGKVDGSKAPDPADFEFGELDTRYIRAVARYEAKQELDEQQNKAKGEKLTAEQEQRRQHYESQRDAMAEAGTALHDDFHEVVLEGADLGTYPVATPTAQALLDMEDPSLAAQIAYHLATHVEEAKKLAGLSPTAQLRKIGQLEARFSSESPGADQQTQQEPPEKGTQQAKPVKATQAPPPPQNRARGSNATQNVSAATTDFASFEAMAMGGKA